jgi:hypothetical protein
MSKHAPDVTLVIEWSPRGVVTFEPGARSVRSFQTVEEAALTLNSKNALVAVSRRSVFVRTMHVPNAPMAEVEIIVRMRLGELFPLPAHELAYSVELTDEITPEGRLAVIVAMPAADLRRLHEEMQAADIRVQRVVPVAYGSVGIAQTLNFKNAGVVSREEGGIGIDIVMNGILRYSRVSGSAANAAAEVCRTYTVAGLPCGDIVSTAGVSVEDADLTSTVAPLEALAGLWPSKVPTLELPEAVALRAAKSLASRRRLAGFLFLAGVLLALYAYFDYSDAAALVAGAEAKGNAQVRRAEQAQKDAEKEAETLATTDTALKLAFEPGQKLADVVAATANEAPEGIWLDGFTIERGKQMLVRGTASNDEQVAEYMRRLNLLSAAVTGSKEVGVAPRFRDLNLAFSRNGKIDDTPVKLFSITGFPVGNVPAIDTTKKKGAAKK